MRQDDLSFFSKTINVDLKNTLTTPDGETAGFIESTMTELTIYRNNIISNFNARMYGSISGEKQISQHIHFYQHELTRLLDDVIRCFSQGGNIRYEGTGNKSFSPIYL